MSAPELTPVETPIFDDLVIEEMREHIDDEVACEYPKGCDVPPVARFVVLCECKAARLGCARHVADTAAWFDLGHRRCSKCLKLADGYQVVPL